ncbi:PucR family transcriptional regulator [Thermomonospora amylolytica]|uniref:PucR family transcriptional regulator n=1 Tax=Thermomonospora amylolytica TaxID=1411117 RepID=UPI0013008148|nr:helix-turn-helix domain-containing protein [Thermomonospora amylolytica]
MDTSAPPLTGDDAPLPPRVARSLRSCLEEAADEIVQEVHRAVPEYARSVDSLHDRTMRWMIRQTLRHFADTAGRADPAWDGLAEVYAAVGGFEARNDRGLHGLQTAVWVAGQVVGRRLIRHAPGAGWSLDTLEQVTEALFRYLEKITSATAQGYAAAQDGVLRERELARRRLRDLLVADPPGSREAIAGLAAEAGWEVPETITVAAVRPPAARTPSLPPDVLADWTRPIPYVVLPGNGDPDPEVAAALRRCRVAIGPTVPPARGALSLRWAAQALTLMDRGVIRARRPVRCLDHLPTLATALCADLLEAAFGTRLEPLTRLPEQRRRPLIETLLAYIQNGDNAVATAERLQVHEQTIRYRVRQLAQLLGDTLTDADRRTEIALLLHAWLHFHDRPPGAPDGRLDPR